MFEEAEFDLLDGLFVECAALIGAEAMQRRAVVPEQAAEMFRPLFEEYERLTGVRLTHPKDFRHHRLADYGPPCSACGKPLRTPRASRCMECGTASTA
jgi:hypothetical protein